jgi:MoaA/NifB/PqqE/SkfB family radical SAM enzyme
MSSTQISKSDKQGLYKSLLDNKVFKIYEIDENPRIPKTKYDVNLENITKLFTTTQTSAATNLQNLVLNTISEKVAEFDTISYLLLSLSPIWNYLLGHMQNQTQKHTSVTWSAETSRIRHTSTKFGTKSILFIDRLTKDNVEKIRNVFKLCIKNGLKYDTLVVLFYDEDGYEELMKYYKSELNIVPILRLSIMLNYYESAKLINDYQVESVKFQQETTYNDVIRILKNEHRITAKTFNYQSKHSKYITNNTQLLKLLNIFNVSLTIDGDDYPKYFQKAIQTNNNYSKDTNSKDTNSKDTNSKIDNSKDSKQKQEITKYNESLLLIENIDTTFNYVKLIMDCKLY